MIRDSSIIVGIQEGYAVGLVVDVLAADAGDDEYNIMFLNAPHSLSLCVCVCASLALALSLSLPLSVSLLVECQIRCRIVYSTNE